MKTGTIGGENIDVNEVIGYRKDAEELSEEIFNSEWICPQAMLENPLNDKMINNSPTNNENLMTYMGKKIKNPL